MIIHKLILLFSLLINTFTKFWYKKFWKRSMVLPFFNRIWNKNCISIWDNTYIWNHTSLLVSKNYNKQTFTPELIFWNNVHIWNYSFISCIDKIEFENDVLCSDRIFITDHIHDYYDINIPIIKQDLVPKWKVLIWEWSFIGINVVILPWVTIWKKSIIWASSVVINDIPDYCVATWNPAVIIKKFDFEKNKWMKYNN